MFAIQPGGRRHANKELRGVRILATVCHAQYTEAAVLVREGLVGERLAVDALASGAVACGEVSTL